MPQNAVVLDQVALPPPAASVHVDCMGAVCVVGGVQVAVQVVPADLLKQVVCAFEVRSNTTRACTHSNSDDRRVSKECVGMAVCVGVAN